MKRTQAGSKREGNIPKYLSYREAWRRIKLALEKGFYFEAVTLEESIISDRLLSYLEGVSRSRSLSTRTPFAQLITRWRKSAGSSLMGDDDLDLGDAVDEWRKTRNVVVHSLVKSKPGTATPEVEDFIARARKAAEEGERLARTVSKWHKKQLDAAKRGHAV